MAIPVEMLRRVFSTSKSEGAISPADVALVIEIACSAVASDGKIADDELQAVRALGAELHARAGGSGENPASAGKLDALLRDNLMRTRDERIERLRAAADALSNEAARHLAYKASVVTALADLASADEEFEFDIDVQDALTL